MSIAPADLRGPYATVFDVGAYRGDFARACRRAWPNAVVHSFEPLEPKPADVDEDLGSWLWHACALGSRCEIVQMHRNEFVPSSSMLPMAALHAEAFPYTARTEVVLVGMAMLEEFAGQIVSPALLKIDVQGYELEVLKGAGQYLNMFDAIVLEVSHEHLYTGAPTYDELSHYLTNDGFVYWARVDALYHPKRKDLLLQSDELWVRA